MNWKSFFPRLITIFFLASTVSASAQETKSLRPAVGPGDNPMELIQVFINFTLPLRAQEQQLVRAAGGQIRFTYNIIDTIAAVLPLAAVEHLERIPTVKSVERVIEVHAIAQSTPWGINKINATSVHNGGNKGTGVKVAVIDSGIDYDHPDLINNVVDGKNFITGVDGKEAADDDNNHGTHVAGTIAALDNGEGVLGVAPEVDLYALKVLNSSGSGDFASVIAAIEWCVNNGIQVTNNSYGSSGDPGTAVHDAFQAAYNAGVLHIAAAGNSGTPPGKGDNVGFPAKYDSVVAVAATDGNDNRASFSSTGPAVELAAPGVSILSTIVGGGYASYNGTSMASPHVAGTAALVIASGITDENGNNRINDEVRIRLRNTALDLGASGRDNLFGYGRIQANLAAPASTGPQAPIANAGADQSVSDADGNGSESVTLDASGSSDPDGVIVSYNWDLNNDAVYTDASGVSPQVSFAVGSHTVNLQVTDNEGQTSTDTVIIHVLANQPPVAHAGPDQTVTADVNGVQTVTLNGSASTDPDGNIVSYEWDTDNDGNTDATGSSVNVQFSVGIHTVNLLVTDNGGETATDQVVITVNPYSASPTTMHVADLDGIGISNGNTWEAVVTIRVQDSNGTPVAGATISGSWTVSGSGVQATAITDSNGFAQVNSGFIHKKNSSTSFTVNTVMHPSLDYRSGSNHDPDGDSDGTTITVLKS